MCLFAVCQDGYWGEKCDSQCNCASCDRCSGRCTGIWEVIVILFLLVVLGLFIRLFVWACVKDAWICVCALCASLSLSLCLCLSVSLPLPPLSIFSHALSHPHPPTHTHTPSHPPLCTHTQAHADSCCSDFCVLLCFRLWHLWLLCMMVFQSILTAVHNGVLGYTACGA